MLGRPAFAAIFEQAVAGRVRLLNGLYGLLLQHKGLLGRLWARRDDPTFPPEERAAIREHLAPTWPIDGYPAGEARADLVAKQVVGREGEEVCFGAGLDPEAWRALVGRRTYVAQRWVQVQDFAAVVPTSGGPTARRGYPTVGAFAVRGRAAGFYTRFGGKIITARVTWLATFVEPSRA